MERLKGFLEALKKKGRKDAGGEGKKGKVPPQVAFGLAAVAVVLLAWSLLGGKEENPYADLVAQNAQPSSPQAPSSPAGGGHAAAPVIPAFSVSGATKPQKERPKEPKGVQGSGEPAKPARQASTTQAGAESESKSSERVRRELARLREQVRRMRESGHAKGGDVDALVASVDRLVADMIEHMDLSRIHGDVFRGTTAETEALRRLERIMDAVIRLQKKRAELLAVSKQVRMAQRSPEQVVRVEVAPLRRKVEELSAQLAAMKDEITALRSAVREQEKRHGVAVVGPASGVPAMAEQPKQDTDFPVLVGVTIRDGAVIANLRWKGRFFAVNAPGLEIGPWSVEELREDAVIVRSHETGKLYEITMGGPMEIKEAGHAS